MLKIRVIPTLLYRDYGLVKGISFDPRRHVGSPLQTIKVYEMRAVDEIVLLDIAATARGSGPDLALVDDLADECFTPFTVGGGIRSVEDIAGLLRVGADKVAVNTLLVEGPEVVAAAVRRFGSQCIVASIDFRTSPEVGSSEAWVRSATRPTGIDPVTLARRAADLGVGEILFTSADRDGTMTGYDVELTRRACDAVDIPVIASGGAGSFDHMVEVLREGGAAAVAAASIFHFTQMTPLSAKEHLRAAGFPVRA